MTIIYDEIVVRFRKLLVSTPLYRFKFLHRKRFLKILVLIVTYSTGGAKSEKLCEFKPISRPFNS